MTTLVWHDGRILDPSTPIIDATDHGVLFGDGVFEALAVRDGRPRLLDRNLRRLRTGLERIGLDAGVDDDTLRNAIDDLVARSGLADARVRITVTPGPGPSPRQRGDRPTVFVTIAPYVPSPPTVALHLVPWPRNERSPFAGIKAINWAENAHALRVASAIGCDNALFLDTQGRLSECATANVFLVVDDTIVTPSLESGCLEGTVRGALLDAGIAAETELRVDDLDRAEGVFVTTSTTGITPVRSIDGRSYAVDPSALDRARTALAAAD